MVMKFLGYTENEILSFGQTEGECFGNTNFENVADNNDGDATTKPQKKSDLIRDSDNKKKMTENQVQPKNPIIWHRKIVHSQLTDFAQRTNLAQNHAVRNISNFLDWKKCRNAPGDSAAYQESGKLPFQHDHYTCTRVVQKFTKKRDSDETHA